MLSRVPVRGVARDKNQGGHRQELHEADHAKVESAARQCINVPSERDHCDLTGELRKGPRAKIQKKGTVTKKYSLVRNSQPRGETSSD